MWVRQRFSSLIEKEIVLLSLTLIEIHEEDAVSLRLFLGLIETSDLVTGAMSRFWMSDDEEDVHTVGL